MDTRVKNILVTVDAEPYPYSFDPASTALIVIDMQRDFIEPGGFGDTLGNNIALVAAIIPTVRKLMDTCRHYGVRGIHTPEAHRTHLADCPPAKTPRRTPTFPIGDVENMGRNFID